MDDEQKRQHELTINRLFGVGEQVDWKKIATEVAFALGNGYRPELEEDELAALTEAVRQYQSEG